MNWFAILVIIGLSILGLWLYFKYFKLYKIKNIVFVDGSLGTGKSFLSVSLAVRLYKKQMRNYKIKKAVFSFFDFVKPFKKALDKLEEPILYSNIRLRNVKFVKLTKDLIYRKNYRFSYKSVLLIDEFSLMADQFCYKDREMSDRLSLFFKLFRHETRGGYIIINSQSTSDLHYSLKYVLSDYLYIHHKTSMPFFSALKVQEMAYCGDKDGGAVMNVRNEDIEHTLKTMLVLNKYYKYYDTYCYSVFTDGLPVWAQYMEFRKGDSLKDLDMLTLRDKTYLIENEKEEKKK